ncbi:hypothetical protein E2I00_002820, partial [Balaenoptera physalus]
TFLACLVFPHLVFTFAVEIPIQLYASLEEDFSLMKELVYNGVYKSAKEVENLAEDFEPSRHSCCGNGRMASAACCFSEEQFRNLCAELQQPGVGGAGWELLVKSMGVGIYWQLNQPTGHYKAFGVLDDFPPDLFADVYMDFNYRKGWDEFVKELYERECSGETVVYWEVESSQKIHVILAQSTSMPQFPEKLGMIQVRQFKQRLAIQSDGKRGSKVFMYYLDNLDCPVLN